MILKETILSAFTDRGTLLKWLKKVETALNDSTLTDISINQISETQVKMKFTFANGDFVESPVLTLPRGEKGEPGNAGMDGVAATITIGSVTTGAPGTSAVVQNVGTEQDAILQFVIPRGDKGEPGESGTQWYIHNVLMRTTADTTEKLILIDTVSFEIADLQDLYRSISGIGPVRYYKQQGDLITIHSAFFVHSLSATTLNTANFNLFAFNSQGELINIPVEFISDTVSPL